MPDIRKNRLIAALRDPTIAPSPLAPLGDVNAAIRRLPVDPERRAVQNAIRRQTLRYAEATETIMEMLEQTGTAQATEPLAVNTPPESR